MSIPSQAEDLDAVIPDLRRLDALLAREKMVHSADAWLNIHNLLALLASQGRLPKNPRDLAPLIGPIVCKTPQHQQRFADLIDEWVDDQPPPVTARLDSPVPANAARWWQGLANFDRRSRQALAGVLALLTVLLAVGFYWTPEPELVIPPPVEQDHPITSLVPEPTAAQVAIIDRVAPNPLPLVEVVPANWQTLLTGLGLLARWLPWLLAALWLTWRYGRRLMALRRAAPQGESLLTGLHIDIPAYRLFQGAELALPLRELKRPYREPSRRLHVEATARASAEQAGYFTARYRQHDVRPSYLVLVRSSHRDDQSAIFAERLIETFHEAGLDVRGYRFRDDPRWLMPWGDNAGEGESALSLKQLGQEKSAARLIVISEGDILFHPFTGQPHAWIDSFEVWIKRAWLSPGGEGGKVARLLHDRRFRVLPLASANLEILAQWFSADDAAAETATATTAVEPLPSILDEAAESWLDRRPPHGVDLTKLCRQLESYLGAEGMLLLRTLAVYPEPSWDLTRLLDAQLFTSTPATGTDTDAGLAAAREQRLLRLSRLPWLRHAYLPDYLRERLLSKLARQMRTRIYGVWMALLNHLTDRAKPGAVTLPLAVPKEKAAELRRMVKDLLRFSASSGALHDPIFANILLGGKLGLLDFRLPRAIARLLPGGRWLLDVRPLLLAVLLAGAAGYGLAWGWEYSGKAAMLAWWHERTDAENARWPVSLFYGKDTEELAQSLNDSLTAIRFSPHLDATGIASVSHNRIVYPAGAEAVARRLAQRVSHATYGAAVDLQPADRGQQDLRVELSRTYQPLAVFNDVLSVVNAANGEVFRDALKDGGLAPEMVVIPAGQFQMGSPDTEADRDSDESPQHAVTISRAFALGRYEVTFDEYDRFAKATKRKLPDDRGWGRGSRPVINVNWDDANAYAVWLSQQTGKTYRLPSEAEWEYAARAGTQTPWYWGSDESITADYAWFTKNAGGKSHEVGGKRPNAFGLYDIVGNVWEWTADCWHGGYKNAPVDGAAWQEADQGDCGRRVVRGGSWDYDPQLLRSANRYRYFTDVAFLILGFRLARAL